VLACEGAQVFILADKADHKPALIPVAERWAKQHG
jgi:hypothetical protein